MISMNFNAKVILRGGTAFERYFEESMKSAGDQKSICGKQILFCSFDFRTD